MTKAKIADIKQQVADGFSIGIIEKHFGVFIYFEGQNRFRVVDKKTGSEAFFKIV